MASFRIEINGHTIKLSEGTTLPVNIKSGWFTKEWNYDYTFPVTAPLSANRKAFGIIENEAYEVVGRQYKGVMDTGSLRREVLIDVLEVKPDDDDVEFNIYFNRVEIPLLWENLRDIDLPVTVDTIENQYELAINRVYPDTEYYFPHVLNTEFYDDSTRENSQKKAPFFIGNVNGWAGGNSFVENQQDITTGVTINRNTLCPFPSVHAVIRRIFEKSGFRVGGSFMEDDDQKRLFTANNHSLDIAQLEPYEDIKAQGDKVQSFNPVTESSVFLEEYDSTNQPTYFNISNANGRPMFIPGGSGVYAIKVTETVISQQRQFDNVQLRLLVMSGINTIGASPVQTITPINRSNIYDITFEIDLTITPSLIGQPLLFLYEVIDFRTAAIFLDVSRYRLHLRRKEMHIYRNFETPLIKFRPVERLNDHLPDMTFADFLEEIMEQCTLKRRIDYVNRIIYLDYATEELSKKPIPLNGKISIAPKSIQFDKTRKVAYIYHYRDEEDGNSPGFDEVYRNIPVIKQNDIEYRSEVLEDSVDEEIVLNTHPLYTVNSIFVAFRERGISEPLEVNGRISPIRLGYFAGKRSNGRPYARNEFGAHSLVPKTQGTSWAFRKLLWEISTQQDPRTYKLPIVLDIGQFDNLDVDSVISLENSKYIIDEVEGDIEQEGEIEAIFSLKRI